MKQTLTFKDLSSLNDHQKKRLNDLWFPTRYDAAVATVCKDVSSEEYEQYLFIVGDVQINPYGRVTLVDMEAIPVEQKWLGTLQLKTEDETEDSDELYEDEDGDKEENEVAAEDSGEGDEEEELEEEDVKFEYEFQRPTSFSKNECLPLLSIGQMLDILYRTGYDDFYLSACADGTGCDLGNSNVCGYSFDETRDGEELCNVLWESVKLVLSK